MWTLIGTRYSRFPSSTIDLRRFRMFGEYGYIPNRKDIKKKADDRGILVRYLFTIGNHHYQVINPANGHLTTARIIDFTPYSMNFDPLTKYEYGLPLTEHIHSKINMHHAVSRSACAAIPDKQSTGTINTTNLAYPTHRPSTQYAHVHQTEPPENIKMKEIDQILTHSI